MSSVNRILAAVAALVGVAGCERLFPDMVGSGVARLTAVDAAMLVQVLNDEKTCGFGNQAVLDNPEIVRQPDGTGVVTWRVTDCTLDLGALHELSTDCSGVTTSIGGKVTVSATRTIRGTIVDNPLPVVPGDSYAVSMEVDARFDGYVVRRSDQDAALTINSGRLRYTAIPRIAVSKSLGACAVPTSNLALRNLRYEDAQVELYNEGSTFDVEVPTSDFNMQIGRGLDGENAMSGSLTVWDSEVLVPNDGDGVDPNYDLQRFAASYACTKDLLVPEVFECPAASEVTAAGAAKVAVLTFGKLVDYVDDDTRCGFASPGVLQSVRTTGELGKRDGTATFTISSPCVFDFTEETAILPDCAGNKTLVKGRVTVTGTKVLRGIPSGDVAQPLVPTSRDPGEVKLTFSFDSFRIYETGMKAGATIDRGTLSGTLLPRVAIDQSLGACALKTPIATMLDLGWQNTDLTLEQGADRFFVHVDGARIEAQNGEGNTRTNYFAGSITVDGREIALPLPNQPPVLDPNYDLATFEASFSCKPHLAIARSDEDCDLYRMFGENGARLVVQAAAMAAQVVNMDTGCGFEDTWRKANPEFVTGTTGEPGLIVWKVDDCRIPGMGLFATNCLGDKTYVQGAITLDAVRTVTGIRKKEYVAFNSIAPDNRESVTLEMSNIRLDNFAPYTITAGDTKPFAKMTFERGTLAGKMVPILGQRDDDLSIFDVPTPNASITNVTLSNASVKLEAYGKTFRFTIPSARLDAFNGAYEGKANWISGSINIDGHAMTLTQPLVLDPFFNIDRFDDTYECTPHLLELIPRQ